MRTRVPTERLGRWLRFSEKVMGSSEYTMGNVYFSYKDGLILRSTDGCLTSWIRVGESQPFHGELAVSTRLLKGFLIGERSDEIEFEFFEDHIVIRGENEVLRVRIATPKEREAMQPFEEVGETTIKEILKSFDFVTASLEEGDMMTIGTLNGSTFLFSSTSTVLSICELRGIKRKDFCFSVPYASSRRIVKSLDTYGVDGKVLLGISNERLTILTSEFGMQVCGEVEKMNPLLKELAAAKGEEVLPISFQRFVSKAAWILPKDSTLRIVKTKKEIRFVGNYGTVQYRGFVPCAGDLEFETEVSPHKLRSVLSRMSNKLFICLHREHLKIFDSSGRSVIVKLLKS